MNGYFKVYGLVLLLICTVHTTGAMTVYVNDTDGDHGTMVYVPINVSDTPWQVGAMDLALIYDPSVLSPTGIVDTGGLTDGALVINDSTIEQPEYPEWTNATISDNDEQRVLQYGALANNTTATDGVVNISIISMYGFNGTGSIAAVEFEVIGYSGATSPLTVSAVAAYNLSAPYNNSGYIPDTVNITDGYESIYNTTESGTFTVAAEVLPKNGNIDGEGGNDPTMSDAIYLAKHVVGLSGYETIYP